MAITKASTSVIQDDAITASKIADGSVHTDKIADTAVHSSKMADGVVTISKVGSEFKTISALTPATVINVPFGTVNGAAIFTLSMPGYPVTLNLTDISPGITKNIIITGSGGSQSISLTVNGASGVFNRVSGSYNNASGIKNLLQILCVGNSEFWYSYSQIDN